MLNFRSKFTWAIITLISVFVIFIIGMSLYLGISSTNNKKEFVKKTEQYIKITNNNNLKAEYDGLEKEQKQELLRETSAFMDVYNNSNSYKNNKIKLDKLGRNNKIIYLIVNGSNYKELDKIIKDYENKNTKIPIEVINSSNEDEISTFNNFLKDNDRNGDITKLSGLYYKDGVIVKTYESITELSSLPDI